MAELTPNLTVDPSDSSDPYARSGQTFPALTDEQMQRAVRYGTEEVVPDGTVLFARGDRDVDFFLVLSGGVELFDVDRSGAPHMFVVMQHHEFTGEVDLFTDRRILVSARARGATRVVRVKHADFRLLLANEADIGEIIMRAFILRRVALVRHSLGGIAILGPADGADTLRIQRFLVRNNYPHNVIDTNVPGEGQVCARNLGLTEEQLPVVVDMTGRVLKNPSLRVLAEALGLIESVDPGHVFDVAVVGAGPAGLSAAVYAASEGLDTIVIEAMAPGGQAGTSSRIENYLGFPNGISGLALAGRAQLQAQKFGARIAIARRVVSVACGASRFQLRLEDDTVVATRSVVVATGARYRVLDVPNFAKFEGQGLHFAATAMEAQLCRGEPVIVVGGGNAAGQAAIYLSRLAGHVHLLVRASGLAATMSSYLVDRITASPHITLRTRTEITALEGDRKLRRVTWTERSTGATETREVGNVFVMIGATPYTDWLAGCLQLDGKGFVVTGRDGEGRPLPSPFATTRPGMFAVGDVRSGSIKRIASSVGEGSVVIQAVHGFLHPPVI